MRKKILVGLMLGVLAFNSPVYKSLNPSMLVTVHAEEVKPIYDSGLSLVSIKPQSRGTTYFSYKVNGEYPTYNYDKVCFFNEDGSLKEEKENMKGQPIFSDDISTWIDVTKTTPEVAPDSEYYNYMRDGNCNVVLPYSETNDSNEFYIPVDKAGTKVTINVVNVSDTGEVSEVKNYDFDYQGVSIEETKISATISSVSKDSSSETVRISGDKISYVEFDSKTYEANENSLDIKLTSNGTATFLVFGDDTATPEVLNYTVEGLKASVDSKIINEKKVVNKKPIITTDKIPSEKQNKAIKFKVYTDKPCTISCNGVSNRGKELEFTVAGNGKYKVTATDESGNYAEKVIRFNCFTDILNDYKLDRDNQWNTLPKNVDTNIKKSLPKTGGIGWLALVGIGITNIIAGGYMFCILKKEKLNKKDSD